MIPNKFCALNPRTVAPEVRRRKRPLFNGIRLVTSAATAGRFMGRADVSPFHSANDANRNRRGTLSFAAGVLALRELHPRGAGGEAIVADAIWRMTAPPNAMLVFAARKPPPRWLGIIS